LIIKSIITSKVYTYHNLHNLQNLAKWKDQRLESVEIPKGLIELLQIHILQLKNSR